ncbi:hypothetical protein ACSBL2_12685 [Pedobacter sp. AW31-3R]|uniref:hypothetical protein n=1 Tax=Pedobacter sp. AW31-3R TaxID=3445781 RepID=UPI003F9F2FAB
MKMKFLLHVAIALLFFSACKKEKLIDEQPPTLEKEDPLEYAMDSISYRINGTTYSASKYSSFYSTVNYQPYSKIDSITKSTYYISGIKDSVLYSRKYGISNYNDQIGVDVIFIKTYHKNSMLQIFTLRPIDYKELFAVGLRNYPIDYERDRIQNGIALSMYDGYKTYDSESLITPPQLSPDAQKDSKFEITSLKKLKSGNYILEAEFNATVFKKGNEDKKLENGYLRLVLNKLDLIF